MRKKPLIATVLAVLVLVAGILVYDRARAGDTATLRFAAVERGNIQSSVSATGTLSAVTTVNVGTQVSGQVSGLYVDFNDHVRKGQLLARIDPTLAQQAVTDAQANVERARAQMNLAQSTYSRNRTLMNDGLVAKSDFETAQSNLGVEAAAVKSAQVSLDRARQNLSYTSIYAPIDGVVVDRKIDRGQTVAASLSAPELFSIANDLSQMQILTQVSESDIAEIKEGQPVEFTVQALPRDKFSGVVKQVRLQSTTTENVVNYTVVVSVDNREGKLLPGMTARADFTVKSADNVLKVPNAALRFKPGDELIKQLGGSVTPAASSTSRTGAGGNASTMTDEQRAARRAAWQKGGGGARSGGSGPGTLYTLDSNGKLQALRVRTGISDSSFTEVRGSELKEGMKVIVGVTQPQSAATTSTAPASPFQPQRQGGGGGPRGGF